MCKTPEEILFDGPELDLACVANTVVNARIDDTMSKWADAVTTWIGEALATTIKALTTSWVNIGTPGLLNGSMQANQMSDSVAFLHGSLAGLAGVILVISLMVSMTKMVMTNNAQAGVEAFHGLLRFVLVSGGGVAVVAGMIAIADAYSSWIIDKATGTDFGAALAQMVMDTGGLAFILFVVFGALGILVNLVQIVLLVIRGGALVIMAGSLGFTAAAATTPTGKTLFQKHCAWIIAFVLYKPAAATIYAMAFKLMSAQTFGFDDTKTVEHLAGMGLCLLAIVALPAMIRLVQPLSEQMASGKGVGGMLAAGAAIAIPTGAAAVAKGASGAASAAGGGSGGGGSGGGGNATGGESASSATGAPSGGGGGSGASGSSGGGDSGGGEPAMAGGGAYSGFKGSPGPTPPGQPSPFKWGGTSTSPKPPKSS